MSTTGPPSSVFSVTIAGGGVAALEAAMALRDLAGERVAVTIVAPNPEFINRPMAVVEPFAQAPARRYPLAEIVQDIGAELVVDSLAWVDSAGRKAHTVEGEALTYDALLLAPGARTHVRYPHALTVDDRQLNHTMHGLIQDLEGGHVRSVAFVVPGRMAWPLPIYELALMTAERAYDANLPVDITVVTPEDAPLAIFGDGATTAVADLLHDAAIAVITSAYAEVPRSGQVVISPGDRRLEVDRVVALPELYGPAIRGLHAGRHGFIDVDPYGQVKGEERIYAAGDATSFAVKHGGVAAQQADVAAQSIAALAGAPVEPVRFLPVIRAKLLTGARPRYLTARITGGHGFSSQITDEPTWSPPSKIAARYLAPYLDERDRLAGAAT